METAIGRQRRAGHKTGLVRTEEGNAARNFYGAPETALMRLSFQPFEHVGPQIALDFMMKRSVGDARTNEVDTYALRREYK